MNKKIASEISIGVILLIVILIGGVFLMQNKKQISDNSTEIKQIQTVETISQPKEKSLINGVFPIDNVDTSKLGKLQSSSTKEEVVEGSANLKIKTTYETYEKEPNYVEKFVVYNNNKEVVSFSLTEDVSFDLFKKVSNTIYYFGLHVAGYNPGGDMFLGYNGPNAIFRLDLNNGTIGQVGVDNGNGFISDVSPDGNKIAYLTVDTSNNYEIEKFLIQDLLTGKEEIYPLAKEYSVHYPSLLQATFSPDGKNLAFVEVKINDNALIQNKDGGYDVADSYYAKTSLYIMSLETQKQKLVAEAKNGHFQITKWKDVSSLDYVLIPTKDSYSH